MLGSSGITYWVRSKLQSWQLTGRNAKLVFHLSWWGPDRQASRSSARSPSLPASERCADRHVCVGGRVVSRSVLSCGEIDPDGRPGSALAGWKEHRSPWQLDPAGV